jgi:signal transduction histidine kinase
MATILIIEDRPLDRQHLTALLRTQGHNIMEAISDILMQMRERARLVGGRVDVLGRKPTGTIVRVTMPSTRPRMVRE